MIVRLFDEERFMLQNKLMRTILMGALVATLMVLALPSPAFAAPRVIVGVYGGYGPYWGPWGGWGYPGYGYYGGRSLGEVHVKSPNGDAQIFINGAFAGRAKDMKHFYLRPGTYFIEQRNGAEVQKVKVYVTAGKTLKIEFDKKAIPGQNEADMPPPPPAATPAPAPVQPQSN
jgi:hypothetical protein